MPVSRHVVPNRDIHAPRRVVVPDRTVRRSATVAPIINLQPKAQPQHQASEGDLVVDSVLPKRRPIASGALHTSPQFTKQNVRPDVALRRKPSAAISAKQARPEPRNLSKHLARTAGRADLLANALEAESASQVQVAEPKPQKTGWRRYVLFG